MAQAAKAIQKHHQVFIGKVAPAAASSCVREDECFALFTSDPTDVMTSAVSAFVAACEGPLTLSTSIGMATGEFAEPDATRWSDVADSEDIAAARALALIATANQVLATAEVFAAAEIEPLRGASEGGRRLRGLSRPIKVAVAPWGDVSQREILNLPKLRPELKRLENTTADLILTADEIRQALDTFSGARTDTNLQSVKRHFMLLGDRVTEYLETLDETSELDHVAELRSQLSELQLLYTDLPRACDQVLSHIREGKTETSAAELTDRWEQVLDLIRRIHLKADKMILETDGGATVRLAPGWRS